MPKKPQKQLGNLRNLKRNYPLLQTQVQLHAYDLAIALLYQCGAQTIQEKRTRHVYKLSVQIPANISPKKILRSLQQTTKSIPDPSPFQKTKLQQIPTGPWTRRYQKYLKPFPLFSKRNALATPLTIDPRGQRPKNPRQDTLYIDSNLAFGTGTHATTRLSAQMLGEWLGDHPGAKVLDVGCGTGILGMVARRLGAGAVLGVDNDPEALMVAKENLKFNRIKGVGLALKVPSQARRWDLVISNIGLNTLIAFHPVFRKIVKSKGFLILSGILYRDCHPLLRVYRDFSLVTKQNQRGWSALLLKGNKGL